jgi:hypothetical protein
VSRCFEREVFEWRWKDDLNHEFLADSLPSVADVRISVGSFVNGLESRAAAPENTSTAQRVGLWTYEALGRQPPECLLRVADAPAEAQALGRYIRDPKSFTSEFAAVDIHDRVDPEASDEELAIIERYDRGNELEGDPELEEAAVDFDLDSPDADHLD